MQLNTILQIGVVAAAALLTSTAAEAQSLSPMHLTGNTPSATKGVRLLVGNPYKVPITFEIVPMDPSFTNPAPHAVVQPKEVRLAPGFSRSVLVAFDIDPGRKERTIGVCVQPKEIAGPIFPRVCGTYTGIRIGGGGG